MGSKHSKTAKRRRVQRGGSPNVGYDGTSISTASGVPLEINARSDPHSADLNTARPMPQLGGSRRSRRQRGGSRRQRGGSRRQRGGSRRQTGGSRRQTGGCGCGMWPQAGGGGSAGGVYTQVLNNDLIKMSGFAPNGCLRGGSRRRRTQRGGDSYRDLALVSSRPAGHGFVQAVNSDNANYAVVTPYEAMSGGSRKNRSHQ